MDNHAGDGTSDDFFDQILGFPPYTGAVPNLAGNESSSSPEMLQLSSGGSGGFEFPLGSMNASGSVRTFSDHVVDTRLSSTIKSGFQGQSMHRPLSKTPQPPAIPQRKRAKRGQATDPHSIAERLRRERIAERIRALQKLVPNVNKTDRATMLDEIVDYVKFLRLQVKVLSMSRLGGASAVAPLVTDIPICSIEEKDGEDQRNQTPWEKWSDDGTEQQVAKLMEENVGAGMQLLQSKALCIMPISLASVIYPRQPSDSTTLVNPKSDHPS